MSLVLAASASKSVPVFGEAARAMISAAAEAGGAAAAPLALAPLASLEPSITLTRGEGVRVLVLHGFSQSAPAFLDRYKPLLDRKLKFCALAVPSAPFPLDAGGLQRAWWTSRAADPTRGGAYEGFAATRALLLPFIAARGPFDGVLAFSQGAVLAHTLLAEGSLSVKWAVLAAGFPSALVPPEAPPLATPSLHLSSAEDATVAPERHDALAARFAGPVVLRHGHGHALVQKAEHCNAVAEFIRKHSE